MSTAGTGAGSFRFDDYEVDLEAGRLFKSGTRISLREKSFQVLSALLERRGEIVTREDLRRRLWPGDVFVDFENNLNAAIARLREALGDSAENPRFVETLPKRGYRFIGTLSGLAPPESTAPRTRLLVLPFLNLSNDTADEYIADAMTEELITELARLAPGQLAVIARTTSMRYKGSQKDVASIGRELSAKYIVEGSVRPAGGRMRVCVQLILSGDQTHLWADRYDGGLQDIPGVGTAAARAIAAQIGVPPPRAARAATEDLAAYNLYIQGRFQLYRWTPDGIGKARQCFEEAIARDPGFALAYDSLAEVHWLIGFLGAMPPRDAYSAGIFHALRALEIDGTLAETHALLGMYRKELDYNWPEVNREMACALELDPASGVVRFRFALSGLMPHGRIRESVAELERALESDPLSPYVRSWLGEILYLGRENDRAIEQAKLVLELDPAYYLAHFLIGQVRCQERAYQEAIAALHKAAEFSAGAPLVLGWLGMALAESGDAAGARALLDGLHAAAAQRYVPPTSSAWIHLALGEVDAAFGCMDRAIDERDAIIVPIKSYSFLDPVRSDPRYLALLRKMNLEP